MPRPLHPEALRSIVSLALREDAPWGDLTGEAFVPEAAVLRIAVRAREAGIMAASASLAEVMRQVDPAIVVSDVMPDGARFSAGDTLALVHGPARGVLRGERIALNLLQRACAVATRTARYVSAVGHALNAAGSPVRVVDTRKTTPGLRALEKHAVTCGGGHNHRYSLSDAVMVKDNHLAALGGDVTQALRAGADRLPHTTHIEVEVDRLDQIEPVLASGVVGTIMLDNFSLAQLRAGVAIVAGRARIEASGGVTLASIGEIAQTGVDVISVGALTHGVDSLDLGFDEVPDGDAPLSAARP